MGERRRDVALIVCVVALAGAATLGVLSGLLAGLGPYMALLVPVALLYVVRDRLQPVFLSPSWITVLILVGAGGLGYLLRADLAGLGGGGIALVMNEDLARRTVYLFATLAVAVAVGAAIVALFHRRRERSITIPAPDHHQRILLLAASAVPAFAMIIELGPDLLSRSKYLTGSGGGLLNGVAQLAVGAVAVVGYLTAAEKGWARWAAGALGFTYLALFFALSSRRLAIVPLLFAIGLVLALGKRRRIVMLIGALGTVALLPLPLYLRGLSQYGLFPYLSSLGSFSYGDVNWLLASNNVLLAFPISGYTAFVAPHLPSSWLWIELNPAPGALSGWYGIREFMGLNRATPFSTVGDLGNHGLGTVIAVGVGLGMLLGYFDGRAGHYVRRGQPFVAVGLVAMSAFAAVTALQYSTRTFSRLLLYMLVVDVVVGLWLWNRDAIAEQGAKKLRPRWLVETERRASGRINP